MVHVRESAVKPVHLASKNIEDSFVRSGSTTRKAVRQDIGGLMLNSKTPVFEELHASMLKSAVEVITNLDYAAIYELLGRPVPNSLSEITLWLQDEKMIE